MADGATKDGRAIRGDNRRNHLSAAEITRRKSGPVKQLTQEEIANMDPNKPTAPKRTFVTVPAVVKTIEESLQQAAEIAQSTLHTYHQRTTQERQLLDDKALQAVNTAAMILVRIKKLDDAAPIDPTKLSDEELAKLA